MKSYSRRKFIKSMSLAGAGLSIAGKTLISNRKESQDPVPVGIIGLDTSHAPAFTNFINSPEDSASTGFQVTAAYPYGSRTIESSYSRIPEYTESVKEAGVEVVDSIEELLNRVDAVLLLSNDGNVRLEQSMQVLETGKPVFIDKPVAGSLKDVITILQASKQYDSPIFSTSSLRYLPEAQAVRHDRKVGRVMGADTFSPAVLEESHPDLFWYGIHGVEILYTVMGTGCTSVTRTFNNGTDVVVGTWNDDRLGTFRGIRDGQRGYGGTAFGSDAILNLGAFDGYGGMMTEVLNFFRSGQTPVSIGETLEIYAFMEAADESKRQGGASVTLEEVISGAAG